MLLAATGWYLRAWLLGITPAGPLIYVVGAGAVLALTLLAGWTPAVRATHVDPVTALRGQ